VGGEGRELEEGRAGIEEGVDAVAGEQLAPGRVALAGRRRSAGACAFDLAPEVGDERVERGRAGVEGGRRPVDVRRQPGVRVLGLDPATLGQIKVDTVARRDELLDAAAELFAVGGFAGVTMDDIGAATGISGPALYHHFDGKEALLGEMLVAISEHLLRRVQELQRSYVDLWVAALLERQPATDPRVARSAVHAVFGLINSTPYSGRLRRDTLAALLERMAKRAFDALVDP
jgi:AcrR family transcriptional regulator